MGDSTKKVFTLYARLLILGSLEVSPGYMLIALLNPSAIKQR